MIVPYMSDMYSVFQDMVMKIHILQTKENFYKKIFPFTGPCQTIRYQT